MTTTCSFDGDFVPHALRSGDGARAAFEPEHVSLHEGVCSLKDGGSILELALTPHEQGYGGYSTWLSGELSFRDAIAISFAEDVPDDFQFGIGYVHNPDPRYSSHRHVLADLSVQQMSGFEVRTGPPDPGQFASVTPRVVVPFESSGIFSGHLLGVVVDGERACFYQANGSEVISEVVVRIDNAHVKPLRAYFSCYIEEPVILLIRAEDPFFRAGES